MKSRSSVAALALSFVYFFWRAIRLQAISFGFVIFLKQLAISLKQHAISINNAAFIKQLDILLSIDNKELNFTSYTEASTYSYDL